MISLARAFDRSAVHDAVKIDRSERAIFQRMARARVGVAVFQDPLHHHAIETAVAHHIIMFRQICFFVGREVNRLLPHLVVKVLNQDAAQ